MIDGPRFTDDDGGEWELDSDGHLVESDSGDIIGDAIGGFFQVACDLITGGDD